MKDKTLYICHKCDRVYFQVDRDQWNGAPMKYNSIAKQARNNHKCPWEGKKKGGKR